MYHKVVKLDNTDVIRWIITYAEYSDFITRDMEVIADIV